MRYTLLLSSCLFAAVFSSCKKEANEIPVDPETMDAVWMKISIPEQQRGVSAIYGSIDDTLVVATMYNIYITTDQGTSWELVHESKTGISGFSMVDGELCALSSFGQNVEYESAFSPMLYSLDCGKTWTSERKFDYQVYDQIRRIRDHVTLENGMFFRIDNNLKPEGNTGMSFVHGPNKLFKGIDGTETQVYFPFKRYLNYLHLDANERLYIGADGSRFEGEEEKFVHTSDDNTALIYFSREPVSQW